MGLTFDIHRFESIDSTNTWVMAEARRGGSAGLIAVADVQTAGRGRLGRTWVAPPGASLLMSVLLRPEGLDADRLHLATAAVSMAGADSIADVAGFVPALKWPNDLIADGRKLAGVLTEVEWTTPPAVVVGIGINCTWPTDMPAEIAEVAIAANHVAGRTIDRDAVLDGLTKGLAARLDAGWDAVAAEYRARCATIGQDVRVELNDLAFAGTATGVTDAGHLVVHTADGERVVTAGDVIHLRPAP